MFKKNVRRLKLKIILCAFERDTLKFFHAVLKGFTAIDLSPSFMFLHPNQPQKGLDKKGDRD